METTRARETSGLTDLNPPARVAVGACLGAAAGAIPFGRLRGWGRVAYSAVPGVLGALAMGLRTQETPAVRLRLAVLLAGAGAAGQNLGIVVDRAAEGWLRRHGVGRPRLVLIGVGAVHGALTFGKDAARDARPESAADLTPRGDGKA